MNYSKENILEVLKKVIYPPSGKDIVTLGMVSDITCGGNKISFSLIFDKSNDPFIVSIKKACIHIIHKQIDEKADVSDIHVKARTIYEEKKKKPDSRKIIAVASGKGGVGKSTIAVNLSVTLAKQGFRVGLIDADIYGPSVPKMFNTENTRPLAREEGDKMIVLPVEKYGVKMLSIGFFVKPSDALVWRGPMATNALRQLIHDADWTEIDYLLIDLPPGTGDIHLTLVQEVAVTGAIIVSTPQEVALADAIKGISMFRSPSINVPILGLVENMSWFTPEELPENKYYLFGKEGCKKLAEEMDVPLLGQIPIIQSIREGGDEGLPAVLSNPLVFEAFEKFAQRVVSETEKRIKTLEPTRIVEIKK